MRIWRVGLMPCLRNKILDPLLQILSQGAEPRQLAFSMALGATLGVFPICGTTTFLCGMVITVLRHRCHAPTVMLVNLVATPVELSLVIPFLHLGEVIFGGPPFPLTSDAFKKVVTGQASTEILIAISHALLGWAIAAPFIFAILYIVSVPCFRILVQKFRPPTVPEELLPTAEIKIKV